MPLRESRNMKLCGVRGCTGEAEGKLRRSLVERMALILVASMRIRDVVRGSSLFVGGWTMSYTRLTVTCILHQ